MLTKEVEGFVERFCIAVSPARIRPGGCVSRIRCVPDMYPEPLFTSGYGGGWIRVSSTPGLTLDMAQQSIWPI
jgi:hypothetical protein